MFFNFQAQEKSPSKMNSEYSLNEDKENWLGLKFYREKYVCERYKSLREKFVNENRKKLETLCFQNTSQFLELVQKENTLLDLVNYNQKLKAFQNKEVKSFLANLRILSKQDQNLFKLLIDNESFIYFHKNILENKNCSAELQHDALWNVSIASNFNISQEKCELLTISISSLTNKLESFSKLDQIVFLEKMLFSLTNFMIDHPEICEILKSQHTLQHFAVSLLSEHNSDIMSLSLWFIRNLVKNSKTVFEAELTDYSLQNYLFSILKNNLSDLSLLFEVLWTIVHLTDINTNYPILKEDLVMMIIQIALNQGEFALLPALSILGNVFTSFEEESLIAIIKTCEFYNLIQTSLLSPKSLIQRECLFLLSNLAGKSNLSATFITQKPELMSYIAAIIKNKEVFLYKEALFIFCNLCHTSDQETIRVLSQSFLATNATFMITDEELNMLIKKINQYHQDLSN